MGLGGTVVKTAGKAAVTGTKTLAKGTGKAVKGTVNSLGDGVSKLIANSKTKSTSTQDSRVKKAESMMKRVVHEIDTTDKSTDIGY